jgi:hypothetical protein
MSFVPPLSQHQKMIDNTLYGSVAPHVALSREQLLWQYQRTIRHDTAYTSCAPHFLPGRLEQDDL